MILSFYVTHQDALCLKVNALYIVSYWANAGLVKTSIFIPRRHDPVL